MREFQRIGEEILQHLLQPLWIGDDRRRHCGIGEKLRSSPFCTAEGSKVRRSLSSRVEMATGCICSSSWPASILEISRISLISTSRSLPAAPMVRAELHLLSVRLPDLFSASSGQGSAELSGVRSSCDMWDRNSDL